MKEKILFIVEAMGGGVFTYIVDLSNKLIESYDVYIAYSVRPQTPINFKTYFDKRIKLLKVKNFERSINPLKDIRAFSEIKEIAKNIVPDIIHLHSSKAGVLGRWAFNGHKIPLFYTPHGYSFLMENHGLIKQTIFKLIEYLSAKRYCTTISCSYGEHQETLKFTQKAVYVDNGINIKELQQTLNTVKRSGQHEFTVFTLGRICYQKNPRLFNQIAMKLPDIKFVWIGDGEMRSELTALNIEITGWINRCTALKKSNQADVFLLPSLWEGLPMSLLEAMYMKKCCVVSNVIGNKDVIHTGVNGFVCDNIDDYVTAISNIKEGTANSLIEQAYTEVLEKYNTEVMAQKYNLIYKRFIMKGNKWRKELKLPNL